MTNVIAQAGNTVVPAILALETLGYEVTLEGSSLVATANNERFLADDPVGLLGLVKLVQTRGWSWQATDQQIDEVLKRFGWSGPPVT